MSGNYELAFQQSLMAADPSLAQTVANVQAPSENYFDAMLRAANSLILADSQRRLLAVQLDRAKQGLPPLDSGQYGLGVNVGISPETQRSLMIGAGVVGLALLVLYAGKRGRS